MSDENLGNRLRRAFEFETSPATPLQLIRERARSVAFEASQVPISQGAPVARYLALSDVELANHVAAGDPNAPAEARRRFTPVATLLARRLCSRLAHRGGRCPGVGCDHAFTWVLLDLLDQFAGHEATPQRSARKALLVNWAQQARHGDSFADYALGPRGEGRRGTLTGARRAWNRARGLRVRVVPSRDLRAEGPDQYSALLARRRLGEAARQLGLDRPADLWRWAAVLNADACETGLADPIDERRVARYLLGGDVDDPGLVQAVALLARAVDNLLASHWPDWYDEYLARPRQHTRRALASPDVMYDQLADGRPVGR
jgi:hypothetical protein